MSEITNPAPNVLPFTQPEKSELEQKLIADTERIKEDMKRLEELTEIKFLPGLEERVGYFPILEYLQNNPIIARFGYGFGSPNMSSEFFDKSEGSQESQVTGDRNTRIFLESQRFGTEYVIQALGKFEGNEPQIEEVDRYTLKDKNKAVGNVVFTRDPEVTLIIKPADCPTGVLYCKDKDGRPVVAIIHGGADSINSGLIRQGLQALQLELGVDLSDAKLAIFPGVSKENFYLSKKWKTKAGEIKTRDSGFYPLNWGEHMDDAKTDDPEEERHVDILSAYEMQALQAGMKPENIQAYRVNTYEDAARGRAYSRRYSYEHDNDRPGGNIIAVQINPRLAESFAKAA